MEKKKDEREEYFEKELREMKLSADKLPERLSEKKNTVGDLTRWLPNEQ